ncbi:MAG: hypothetical protein JWO95_2410, partial [Verrucomicrobiales bacterium]|nr:hypothetical protein [Verrucomicrobiales bacterium]
MAGWFQAIKRDYADLQRFEAEIDHLREWCVNSSGIAPQISVHLLWLQAYPLHHRGKDSDVLRLIERALIAYDELGVKDVLFRGHLLNDLGATQNLLKNFEAGAAAIHEALKIRREVLGEEHVDTAMSLYNTAIGFVRDKDYHGAVTVLEKAYAVWNKTYSPDDVYALMAQCALAEVYFQLKRTEALEFAETTLRQAKNKFGEKHPLTAAAYHQLGHVLYAAGDKRSVECYSTALALRRELLGEENFFTIDSIKSTVGNLCAKGFHSKAEAFLKDYLAKLPEAHPDYKDLFNRKRTIYDGVVRPGFRTRPMRR